MAATNKPFRGLRTGLVAAALAAALAGCATTRLPPPERQAAPAAWRNPATGPAAVMPAPAWWRQLGDPELDRLVDQALAGNPDLAIAAARLKQARALADAAAAARRPTVELRGEAKRSRTPASRTPDPYGDAARVPPHVANQYSGQVGVGYEIDLFGRLALASEAAKAEWTASEFDQQAVRLLVVHEVVAAYLELRLTESLLRHARQAGEMAQALVAAEQRRLSAGVVARPAVVQAEDELAKVGDSLPALVKQQALAQARLAAALGQPPVELAWTAAAAAEAAVPAIEPDLPAMVLERRPDLQAAWQRVVAAAAESDRAPLERYPSLNLTGSLGYLSEAFRRWLTGDALAWAAGAALQTPLFDGGRIEARVQAAAGRRAEREAEYRKTVLQALREVEQALAEADESRQRTALADASLARREADVARARRLAEHGFDSTLPSLRADLARIEAAQAAALRRHEQRMAWASAQKALGR